MIVAQNAYRTRSYSVQASHCKGGLSALKQLEPSPTRLRDEILFNSGLANAYRRSQQLSQSAKVSAELLRLAEQHNDTVAEINGWFGMLYLADLRSDEDEIIRLTDLGFNAADRAEAPYHFVRVAGAITQRSYRLTQEQTQQRVDEFTDLFEKENATGLLAKMLQIQGDLALWDNEHERAESLFAQAISIAFTIWDTKSVFQLIDERLFLDYPFAESFYSLEWIVSRCRENLGRIYRQRGEWEKAVEQFCYVYERKKARRDVTGTSGLLNVIADTQLLGGAVKKAEISFFQSWRFAQEPHLSELKAMVLSTGISIALELENDAQAKARLQLFEDVTRHWSTQWTWHKKQMTHGILSLRVGAIEDAVRFLTEGFLAAQEEKDQGLIPQYSIQLAALHVRLSNREQALHYMDIALRSAKTQGYWRKGVALLESARSQMQASFGHETSELISQAIKQFQKAGRADR